MTEMTTAITVAAPASAIYAYAHDTERWPEILPHYRSVRVLARNGPMRVVAMKAWRDAIPISWVAEQIDDPDEPSIRFRHVAGATRGMDVEWRFTELGDQTRVTIAHRIDFAFPIASRWLGKHVVGEYFIDHVARKTLACMKTLAEAR